MIFLELNSFFHRRIFLDDAVPVLVALAILVFLYVRPVVLLFP